MPFKFVDDGYPEADDYASNYVWVDPLEPRESSQPKAPAVLPTRRPPLLPNGRGRTRNPDCPPNAQ